MKRSEALAEIKQRGWHKDLDGAERVQIKKGIGYAAARKAYQDGIKARERGEPCDCPACKKGAAK
jgi:hypothetical protein